MFVVTTPTPTDGLGGGESSRGTVGVFAGGGGTREVVRVEACATMEKMIFIPTLKPQAQGGVRFSDFHAPPCANFCT